MGVSVSLVSLDLVLASQIQVYLVFAGESLGWVLMGGALVLGVMGELDCEQSLTMVTRARKARARKSSEASESRGEAGEKAGKEPLSLAFLQFPSRPIRSLQSCRA